MSRLPSSERARWTLVVAAGCLVMVAINVWWVATYRHGYPMDIDEAGYTMIAINDHLGFENGGLSGWWDAIQSQTPHAPLLPALTSVVHLVSTGVMQGFLVLILFGALLTLAAFGIGERLAGPRLGALAALVVATSQGMFIFSREYIFALPTAALLSCAVYALLLSDGLRLRRWAIACGALLGLMLLARTMAIAFVPGVLVAALAAILTRGQGDLPKRFLNLGLLVASGVLVAATWYWNNIDPVVDYLTDFGYGSQAQNYGAEHSLLSWDRWNTVAGRMAGEDLLAPLAVLLFAALVALAVLVIRRLRASEDRGGTLLKLASTDAFAVLVVVLAGYAALTSSRNGGNGFSFPVSMLVPPLAVVALRHYRRALIPAVALVGAIAAINLVAHLDLSSDLSRSRSVLVPGVGQTDWINGEPHAVVQVRRQVPGPPERFVEADRAWLDVDAQLAQIFLEPTGPEDLRPVAVFGVRSPIVNSNTVALAALLNHREGIGLSQILAEPDDSVASYETQLGNPLLGETVDLITTSANPGDYEPAPTQSKVEAAARRQGYRQIREIPLPDGRELRLWTKTPPAP
ncbi:MAG TPA: glycosyltransferase family 39 protein [Solirubrobacterales bacterium]|nr:glycosyltransferase family 39 protein [Solirubrobacterales bacterium]